MSVSENITITPFSISTLTEDSFCKNSPFEEIKHNHSLYNLRMRVLQETPSLLVYVTVGSLEMKIEIKEDFYNYAFSRFSIIASNGSKEILPFGCNDLNTEAFQCQDQIVLSNGNYTFLYNPETGVLTHIFNYNLLGVDAMTNSLIVQENTYWVSPLTKICRLDSRGNLEIEGPTVRNMSEPCYRKNFHIDYSGRIFVKVMGDNYLNHILVLHPDLTILCYLHYIDTEMILAARAKEFTFLREYPEGLVVEIDYHYDLRKSKVVIKTAC